MPHIIILGTLKQIADDLIDYTDQAHTIIEGGSEGQYPNLEAKMGEIETVIEGTFSVDGLGELRDEIKDLVDNPS